MEIDIEKLREDMKQQCYAAFFVGGFGGALNESFDSIPVGVELIDMCKTFLQLDSLFRRECAVNGGLYL